MGNPKTHESCGTACRSAPPASIWNASHHRDSKRCNGQSHVPEGSWTAPLDPPEKSPESPEPQRALLLRVRKALHFVRRYAPWKLSLVRCRGWARQTRELFPKKSQSFAALRQEKARRRISRVLDSRYWHPTVICAPGRSFPAPMAAIASQPCTPPRQAATAGNVCTMSPSEPSLTTKKCSSPMRSLAHRFQEFPRGVIFCVTNNRHANAQARSGRAFRH